MTYNSFCNLVSTLLSNLIFIPESFFSPHLTIHLSQIWVLYSSENKSCCCMFLFFCLHWFFCLKAFPDCKGKLKTQFGGIKFGSKCLFGENAFEIDHSPWVFHVSEILVPCREILPSTVFLSIFYWSFKNCFQFLFSLGTKFKFIFLNEI